MIESINFELSEPQLRHDQALETAMEDARRKVEHLASRTSAQLGAVWTISEIGRFPLPGLRVPEVADVAQVPVEPVSWR